MLDLSEGIRDLFLDAQHLVLEDIWKVRSLAGLAGKRRADRYRASPKGRATRSAEYARRNAKLKAERANRIR